MSTISCVTPGIVLRRGQAPVAADGVTELADLFARILIRGVRELRRRGLERGYAEHDDEIRAIRGKIHMLDTEGRLLSRHGLARCQFDELTVDTAQNRVIKSAIVTLSNVPSLDRGNRAVLQRQARELTEIRDLPLSAGLFREIRFHANNRHYKFLTYTSRGLCSIKPSRTSDQGPTRLEISRGSGPRWHDSLGRSRSIS